jgi:hypothetical protein
VEWGFYTAIDSISYTMEGIEFCQCHPIQYEYGRYVMVRKLACIQKDLCTVKKWNTHLERRSYLKAIADGGLACTQGLPIFTSFYKMINKASIGRRSKKIVLEKGGLYYLSKGVNLSQLNINYNLAVSSMCIAFNITFADIQKLESIFESTEMTTKNTDDFLNYNNQFYTTLRPGQSRQDLLTVTRYDFACYNCPVGTIIDMV